MTIAQRRITSDRGWIAGVALVMPGPDDTGDACGRRATFILSDFREARRGAPPHAGEPYMPQPAIRLHEAPAELNA